MREGGLSEKTNEEGSFRGKRKPSDGRGGKKVWGKTGDTKKKLWQYGFEDRKGKRLIRKFDLAI